MPSSSGCPNIRRCSSGSPACWRRAAHALMRRDGYDHALRGETLQVPRVENCRRSASITTCSRAAPRARTSGTRSKPSTRPMPPQSSNGEIDRAEALPRPARLTQQAYPGGLHGAHRRSLSAARRRQGPAALSAHLHGHQAIRTAVASSPCWHFSRKDGRRDTAPTPARSSLLMGEGKEGKHLPGRFYTSINIEAEIFRLDLCRRCRPCGSRPARR